MKFFKKQKRVAKQFIKPVVYEGFAAVSAKCHAKACKSITFIDKIYHHFSTFAKRANPL